MAHPATARPARNLGREAVGDDPVPGRVFDEDRSFALGAYAPSDIQADWANFELLKSLPEDVENG